MPSIIAAACRRDLEPVITWKGGSIRFSRVETQQTQMESEVSESRIPNNLTVIDHARFKPERITFTGMISCYTCSYSPEPLTVEQVKFAMVTLQYDESAFFTIYTNRAYMFNMILERFTLDESSDENAGARVTMTFVAANLAGTIADPFSGLGGIRGG